jgi:hypothetical protein
MGATVSDAGHEIEQGLTFRYPRVREGRTNGARYTESGRRAAQSGVKKPAPLAEAGPSNGACLPKLAPRSPCFGAQEPVDHDLE